MESIKDKLISSIEEISKKYRCHGFWKLGSAYIKGVSREDNPYLYFPSEEHSHKALMEEFDKLTEEDFVPLETIDSLYFKKRPENEEEVYERLFFMILHNARQKFIKSLDC